MPHRSDFDYIIIGAGLSGLSLVLEILNSPVVASKSILILEKSLKNYPNRTWCFWEESGVNTFQHLVHCQWNKAEFILNDRTHVSELSPFNYKMIRSETFRDYAFKKIRNSSNVKLLEADIDSISRLDSKMEVQSSSGKFSADLVFDSRFDINILNSYNGHVFYQQFTGWFIETEKPVFDPEKARLMDFRASQRDEVAFFYVLPEAANKALVEFTLFTQKPRPQNYFKEALKTYISQNFNTGYHIQNWEYGNIPMTDFPFYPNKNGVIPIGTAGGCSKTSTGYTFTFIQKQVKNIVSSLSEGKVYQMEDRGRFNLYDRILLNILNSYPEKGADIFFTMFEKNPAEKVLRFLNNESTIPEEINLFSRMPIGLFSKAAVKELAGIKKNQN